LRTGGVFAALNTDRKLKDSSLSSWMIASGSPMENRLAQSRLFRPPRTWATARCVRKLVLA
jgi:hypothetical protein